MKFTLNRVAISVLLLISAAASAHDYELGEIASLKIDEEAYERFWEIRPVISLRGGIDYAKVNGNTAYAITNYDIPIPDSYIPEDEWHSAAVWGGFLGIEFPFFARWSHWQTGVSYYHSGNFEASGYIHLWSVPDLINLEYEYDVRNQRVLWENKWLADLNCCIDLYLLFGLGWSQNKAFNYREIEETIDSTRSRGHFIDDTQNSFTYSLGLGIEFDVIEHIRFGIGYQYSDLGEIALGHREGINYTTDAYTDESLELNEQTPTHEIIANLTFIY